MPYSFVTGDLLESDCEYIAQQNCCTAVRAHGLSALISTEFPEVNPYSCRKVYRGNWSTAETRGVPGTIQVYRGVTDYSIICMFAQYNHGKPGVYKDPLGLDTHDTPADRMGYFRKCLEEISKLSPKSVGFPFKIGSGLAGGSWLLYERMIRQWSTENPEIIVKIYRLPGA